MSVPARHEHGLKGRKYNESLVFFESGVQQTLRQYNPKLSFGKRTARQSLPQTSFRAAALAGGGAACAGISCLGTRTRRKRPSHRLRSGRFRIFSFASLRKIPE